MPRFQDDEVRKLEGDRLVRLRAHLQLSQRELAAEFQVTGGAVAQWEAGQKTIPGPVLHLIDLYERELNLAPAVKRSTTALKVGAMMAGSLFAESLFASAPASSIRARVREVTFKKYVEASAASRGLAMKWMHLLWSVDAMLSPEKQAALSMLEAQLPSMSPSAAARVFFEECGVLPRAAFAEWDPVPFANTSLGQVHRALLSSGQEVVVKIQHPTVAQQLKEELSRLRSLGRIASPFMRETADTVHTELEARFLEECDYVLEANHQRRMRELHRSRPDVVIPEVIEQWSRRRVLTSAYVEGASLTQFAGRAPQRERDRAGTILWSYVFSSILRDGMFNADSHPGNFLFGDGKLICLDFGRTKVLGRAFVAHWKRLLRAVFERDEAEVRRALIEIGYARNPATFDFSHATKLLWWWSRPGLTDDPFKFSSEYLKKLWSVYVSDTTRDQASYSADMVLLPQVMLGTSGLLAKLRATVHCREVLLSLVYAPGEKRPAPYSKEELERHGLGTQSD